VLLAGAGRTAHEAADAVKHEWNCMLISLVLVDLFAHLGLLLAQVLAAQRMRQLMQ